MKTAVTKPDRVYFTIPSPSGTIRQTVQMTFLPVFSAGASPALRKPLFTPLCRVPDTPEKPLKYKK